MSDVQFIPGLLKLASNVASLDNAEAIAGQELLAFDGEKYPADGCAITQSTLLRLAGASDLPFTFQALAYVDLLQKRGWQKIAVGQQKAGDIGTTVFGGVPHHGIDHVYLVLQVLNQFENLIADNQARAPHLRYTDGRDGRSLTTTFLRATNNIARDP